MNSIKNLTLDDISKLSDVELRDALKNYEQNPGPITESTRGIYRKKLASLIQNQTIEEDVKDHGNDDEDEDTSDEDFVLHDEESDDDEELSELEEEEKEELLRDLEKDVNTSRVQEKENSYRMVMITFGVLVFSLGALFAFKDKLPFYKAISFAFWSLLLYGLYSIYKYYRKRNHRHAQKVCDLVADAIELLQSPENPKGMMPVLHIRDTLLTPAERNSKKTIQIWNECVRFIENHESRIKIEMVNVDGEDFKAWKWIGSRA